jgi:hypothetical protein
MKPYEWVKAFTLVCLCVVMISSVLVLIQMAQGLEETSKALRSTLVTAQVTLDSLTLVGPQTVKTLKTLQTTTEAAGKQTRKVGAVLDKTAETLDNVNRLCGVTGKPCGTLADVNRTLATVRGAFGQVELGARHFNANLDMLDVQEKQTYEDIHRTTTSLNALVASPDIARFLKSSADTSMEVTAIAADIHREADRITAPQPWYKKLYTYGNTGVNIACLATHSCPF